MHFPSITDRKFERLQGLDLIQDELERCFETDLWIWRYAMATWSCVRVSSTRLSGDFRSLTRRRWIVRE